MAGTACHHRGMRVLLGCCVGLGVCSARVAAADEPGLPPMHKTYLMAMHVAASVGGVAVERDAAEGGNGYGALASLSARAQVGDAPAIAFGGDLDVGYADGELIGQLRLGVGAGAYVGRVALTALAGGTAGGLGPASPAELFLELSAGYYPQLNGTMVWGGVSHAEGLDDRDRDQLELRFAVPSPMKSDLGLFFGMRAARIGDAGPPEYVGLLNVGLSIAGGL